MPIAKLSRLIAALLAPVCLAQCQRTDEESTSAAASPEPEVVRPLSEEERLQRLVLAEEWILSQTPRLKALSKGLVGSNQLPGDDALKLFTGSLRWHDLASPKESTQASALPFVRHAEAPPIDEAFTSKPEAGLLWKALTGGVRAWKSASFKLVSASQLDNHGRKMSTLVHFEGLAQRDNQQWRSVHGDQVLTWDLGYDDIWRISEWVQEPLTVHESPRQLFAERLDDVLASQENRTRARTSYHEQNLIKLFTEGKFTTTDPVYARYQDLESSHQHPGLAVVDIDNDGWDELYVMGRWGRNQLFQRRSLDGLYEDIAPSVGLALDGYCNSALFADYDNDGDPDVFIGRSLKRSLYLENVDGQFVDRSKEAVAAPLPYLVSSISAADYNNDGFLDVYLGLYGPTSKESPVAQWAEEFFPLAMAKELVRRADQSHRYLDLLGPPNLLLENRGGRFTISRAAGSLAEWRNTYQSVWSDFDADGDPDLYVCNDFAPDAFYENDGGTFRDVSREVAGEGMMGFGMGASWADYNRDGRLDLYVSNMFSKAGRRITAQISGLDDRVPYSAQGSLLFRNDSDAFTQVAGTGEGDLHVAKVGWSFGGLFVDADNDGYPDIYSASGYYTAPAVTRSDQDL